VREKSNERKGERGARGVPGQAGPGWAGSG
jgi:hypothetical protein